MTTERSTKGDSGPERQKATPAPGEEPPAKLPDERDESAGGQTRAQHESMRQAGEDLSRGLVDTDRGPLTDALYEDSVRPKGESTRDRAAPDEP